MHRFAAPLVFVLALACTQATQGSLTQLIVVVDTDYAIPTELDEIDVLVTGPDGAMHTERQPMARTADLPYTLTVVPSGSALGPVRVDATGLLAGASIVTRAARVTLVANQTTTITLNLVHACDRSIIACTNQSQTCGDAGTCVSIDQTPHAWTGLPAHLAPDAAAPSDASTPDAGSPDAAVDCTTTGCDDHQPCTDDVCTSSGTCMHTNNTLACDDGMFCNGLDTCGGGTCSAHQGSPCVGSNCNEAAHQCGTCSTNADCPQMVTGAWGACSFANACATSGTQTRTVQTFFCQQHSCMPNDMMQTQACTRTTDGTTCTPTSCTAWSPACNYVPDCHATGQTQSRTCTDYACARGQGSAAAPRMQTQPCPQAAVGTDCTDTTTVCDTRHCDASGTCAHSSGGCTSGRVCCNPPMCAPPLTC